jgi:hypothetical protein
MERWAERVARIVNDRFAPTTVVHRRPALADINLGECPLCVAVIQKSASPNFGSPNKLNALSRHWTPLALKGGRFSAAWLAFFGLFDLSVHSSCTRQLPTDRSTLSKMWRVFVHCGGLAV